MALWMLMMTLAGLSVDDALVREHLPEAEATLRARDTSHLSPALRAERARNLDRLRAYWQRGQYPRNTHHPGERVPYFIDDVGTTCAMAHLVIESGHEEVARMIAGRENNARIRQMQSPELAAWLASSGLTLEEASLIQPSYEPQYPCDCPCVFDPVHARQDSGVSYVNECVAVRCGRMDPADLRRGCSKGGSMLVTGNWTDHGDADACRRRRRVEYENVHGTYAEAEAAFVSDVCEGPREPGGEAPACQVVRTPGGGVPWAVLVMIGVVGVGRRRRVV